MYFPGDSKCPFHPLVRGHWTPWNGHLTIPKRSHWITRLLKLSQKTITFNRQWMGKCAFIWKKSTLYNNHLSGRLTQNLKMMVWKMIFLYTWVMFWFHVNLPGCIQAFVIQKKWFQCTLGRWLSNRFHWGGFSASKKLAPRNWEEKAPEKNPRNSNPKKVNWIY